MGLSWITVSDIEKAKKLFVDVLGMKVGAEAKEYNWLELELNGIRLGIGQSQENFGPKPGHNAIVTFVVDDISEAKKVFEQKGVRIEGDIMEVPGHVKLLTFFDNDGNMFQLVEDLNKSLK